MTAPPTAWRWPAGARRQLVHATSVVLAQLLSMALLFAVLPRKIASPYGIASVASAGLLQAWVIVGLLLLRIARARARDLDWRGRDLGKAVVLSVGGFVCATVGLLAIMRISLGGDVLGEWLSSLRARPPAAWMAFTVIGLSAGFTEESIFRGYLQPGLIARLGAIGGVLATAVLFALYHVDFRPSAFLGKLWLGLVYGVLRGRRGPLLASGLTHALTWVALGDF